MTESEAHAAPERASVANILIVEDEHAVRAMLRDLLELAGHAVREAADGDAVDELLAPPAGPL